MCTKYGPANLACHALVGLALDVDLALETWGLGFHV
jgi:hypothetical protein